MPALHYDNLLDGSGKLRPEAVSDLMVEVVSGRYLFEHEGEVYANRVPTPAEIDTARMLYAKKFAEARAAGCFTRTELEQLAVDTGEFDPIDRANKAALNSRLSTAVKARDAAGPALKKTLAGQIMGYQEELRRLVGEEEWVYQNSAENRAEESRTDYLVSRCTMSGDFLDESLWPTWADYQNCTDEKLLLESRQAYLRVSVGLPVNIIRSLARTPEWRQRWRAARDSQSAVFEGSSATWDQNKLNLISWSDFFDSVLRHPDCPGEDLIHHDDSLQAWVNAQVEEVKQIKLKRKQNKGDANTQYVADGKGGLRPMTQLGRSTTKVNSPVRYREQQKKE